MVLLRCDSGQMSDSSSCVSTLPPDCSLHWGRGACHTRLECVCLSSGGRTWFTVIQPDRPRPRASARRGHPEGTHMSSMPHNTGLFHCYSHFRERQSTDRFPYVWLTLEENCIILRFSFSLKYELLWKAIDPSVHIFFFFHPEISFWEVSWRPHVHETHKLKLIPSLKVFTHWIAMNKQHKAVKC